MLLLGAPSLRDVIAFSKLRDGSCPLLGAPDRVDAAQLFALSLRLGTEKPLKKEASSMDTAKIAGLSRLCLSEPEKASLPGELSAILGFADAVAALSTEGVPEMASPAEAASVFREDMPELSLPQKALLAAAPAASDGCILVPKTFS